MQHGTRLTRQNMHIIANEMDISVEELEKKRIQAKQDFQKQQDKIWTMEKLGTDIVWLEQTLKKVHEIGCSLPKDTDTKERTIKMYGWIAEQFPKMNLSMPLQDRNEYTRADCMGLILTNPSMYRKIQNWD
jgi:hypothetical protein